jgi:hypothetical protein
MAAYKATVNGSSTATFAVPNFVPEIWTGRLIANLQAKTIMPSLCTREFEGDIKGAGDTVWVHGVGRVATHDYLVNDTVVDYQNATDGKVGIMVEKSKYWAFRVEDIEQTQSKPAYVNEYTKEAAFALAKDVDRYLYQKFLAASTEAVNPIGLAGGGDLGLMAGGDNFYNSLVDLGIAQDDALAPDEGRFVIVPTFAEGFIRKDARFIANGQDAGNAMKLAKKSLGTMAGFEIITMPRGYFATEVHAGDEVNLSDKAHRNKDAAFAQVGAMEASSSTTEADDFRCIAGVRGAMAYVEQLAKTEKLRLEGSFADAVRGLLLYGGGTIKPNLIWQFSLDDPKNVVGE